MADGTKIFNSYTVLSETPTQLVTQRSSRNGVIISVVAGSGIYLFNTPGYSFAQAVSAGFMVFSGYSLSDNISSDAYYAYSVNGSCRVDIIEVI